MVYALRGAGVHVARVVTHTWTADRDAARADGWAQAPDADRARQALALVCLVSLDTRALFLEDGGVVTTLLLLTYTLLLPMGRG